MHKDLTYTRNLLIAKQKIHQSKALLFDMNNTVLNMDYIDWQSYKQPIENKFQVTITYQDYLKYAGSKRAYILRRLLVFKKVFSDVTTIPKSLIEELVKQGRSLKLSMLTGPELTRYLKLLPGAKDFILKQKMYNKLLAIVTSTSRNFTEILLTTVGMRQLFDILITADETQYSKPNPFPFKLAMEKLKVNSKESVAFEDSFTGIRSAKSSGVFTIGVLTPGINNKAVQLADAVITDYRELMYD